MTTQPQGLTAGEAAQRLKKVGWKGRPALYHKQFKGWDMTAYRVPLKHGHLADIAVAADTRAEVHLYLVLAVEAIEKARKP